MFLLWNERALFDSPHLYHATPEVAAIDNENADNVGARLVKIYRCAADEIYGGCVCDVIIVCSVL